METTYENVNPAIDATDVEIDDTMCDEIVVEDAPKSSKLGLIGLIVSAVGLGLFVIGLIPCIILALLLPVIPAILYIVGILPCIAGTILCIVAKKKGDSSKKATIGLILGIVGSVLNVIAFLICGLLALISLISFIGLFFMI